jgi:hypothetical protein
VNPIDLLEYHERMMICRSDESEDKVHGCLLDGCEKVAANNTCNSKEHPDAFGPLICEFGPKLVPENAHGQIDHPYAFTSISFGAVASAPNNAKCRMVVCGHGCLETMLAHPQLHNFYFYELAKEAMRSSLFRGSVVQSVIWCADGKAVGLV